MLVSFILGDMNRAFFQIGYPVCALTNNTVVDNARSTIVGGGGGGGGGGLL